MRPSLMIKRYGGQVSHLVWIGSLIAVSPQIMAASPAPLNVAIAGVCAALLPGLAGLILARPSAGALGRMMLTLLWVSLAAAVTASAGGLIGPAALAFLLPVAAAASYANTRTVVEAASFSGLTALLLAGLQFAGFIPTSLSSLGVYAPGFLPVAVFVSMAFAVSAYSGMSLRRRLGRVARRHHQQSIAFEKSPVPLLKTRDGKITATSASVRALSPGLPPVIADLPLADLGFDDADRAQLERIDAAALTQLQVRGKSGQAQGVRVVTSGRKDVVALVPDNDEDRSSLIASLIEERDAALADANAKTEFLASVSHELRTPLNAIIGFSEAMKSRLFGPVPAKYAEYSEMIHESGRHLLELIGDVLDLSKIEADSYQLETDIFEAGDVVDLCVRMMSQRAQAAGIQLECDIESGLLVEADRKALRQILLNLLSNAIKFTPDNGVVVAMAKRDGDHLVLAIGDSGPGIPEDEVKRLGNRFAQASTARQTSERGSGLGLALVQALAKMHSGEMNVASTLGEGTTVSVRMPVIAEPVAAEPEAPLEVHNRIQMAQSAGETLVSAKAG